MLRLGGKTINDIVFTGGSDVLNLELGGLLRENNVFSSSIGTTATRGVLTAGGGADWRPSKKVKPSRLTARAAAIPTSAERGILMSSSAMRANSHLARRFPSGKKLQSRRRLGLRLIRPGCGQNPATIRFRGSGVSLAKRPAAWRAGVAKRTTGHGMH